MAQRLKSRVVTASKPASTGVSAFDPLEFPACFSQPAHLSDVRSWQQHIPFAFAAMQILRPRTFVELGTHKGDSYLAFCQAVAELHLPTRCYAVDTWAGDTHSGVYDDLVYTELAAYHDERYAGFSRLVRSLFDDAVNHFSDACIDLLHIDGLHTVSAVSHDFRTWLPKLSEHAVVLMHDINVRERGFGVWRLWEELRERYPSFTFDHGNGLGILAVGKDCPPGIFALCDLEEPRARSIRQFYYQLGSRVESNSHALETETSSLKVLRDTMAKFADLLERFGHERAELDLSKADQHEAGRFANWVHQAIARQAEALQAQRLSIEESDKRILALVVERDTLARKLDEQQTRWHGIQAEITQLQHDHAGALSVHRTDYDRVLAQCDALVVQRADHEHASAQRDALAISVEKLHAQLESQRQTFHRELVNLQRDHTATLESFKAQSERATVQRDALQHSIGELHAQLMAQRQTLQGEIAELRRVHANELAQIHADDARAQVQRDAEHEAHVQRLQFAHEGTREQAQQQALLMQNEYTALRESLDGERHLLIRHRRDQSRHGVVGVKSGMCIAEPLAGVELLDEAVSEGYALYRAQGRTADFGITPRGAFPYEWTWVDIELRTFDGNCESPCLYAEDGNRSKRHVVLPLPVDGHILGTVFLPHPCAAIFLHPSSSAMLFELGAVRLRKISMFATAFWMLGEFRRRGKFVSAFVSGLRRLITRHGSVLEHWRVELDGP